MKCETTQKTWTVGTLSYTTGGIVALFCVLLLGDFSWSMRERSVAPMSQWYLQHINVPNFLFALLISSFPALVGLILGPIISVKSDRHRGPRGRRIPFLLVTTPIATFGMVGIGMCPIIAPWLSEAMGDYSLGEYATTVICFGIFWAAFEFATIAATAVFGGLINDIVPKELLGRFYGLFRAVSLLDGMIFNYWLMGKVDTSFTLIMVTIGAFYCCSFLWVCYRVKEGEYPEPPKEEALKPLGFIGETKKYFRECFSKSHYVWIFVMMTASMMSFMPINTFSVPYATSLGMDMDTYGKCLTLTFTISLCLAYFLGWLADKFHPLRVSIAALIGYLAVTVWGAFYANSPQYFATAFVLHGVLSGTYFTCAASLAQRLFPHMKFAQYASASGIIGSVSTMALGPFIGTVIDLSGQNYMHTFTIGCVVTSIALCASLKVHSLFMKEGGPKNYVAPL